LKRKSVANQTTIQTTIKYNIPPDAIYADPTPDNFTQVPNTVIEDLNLSWKSLGILVFLLRNKNKKGWHTYTSSVIQAKKDKKDSVSSGLAELELLGYVLRFRYYDEKKKVRGSFFAYTAHPFKFELNYITKWIRKQGWGFTPSTQNSKEVFQQVCKKLTSPNLKMGNPILENPILENPPLKRKTSQKEKPLKKKKNNKINKKLFDPMEVFMQICPEEMKSESILHTMYEYAAYRWEQGNPIKTKQAIVILVNKLRNFSEDEIIEALERSIMNSWIGVFPKKNDDYGYAGRNKQYNEKEEPEDEYDGLRKPEYKSWKDMTD